MPQAMRMDIFKQRMDVNIKEVLYLIRSYFKKNLNKSEKVRQVK